MRMMTIIALSALTLSGCTTDNKPADIASICRGAQPDPGSRLGALCGPYWGGSWYAGSWSRF